MTSIPSPEANAFNEFATEFLNLPEAVELDGALRESPDLRPLPEWALSSLRAATIPYFFVDTPSDDRIYGLNAIEQRVGSAGRFAVLLGEIGNMFSVDRSLNLNLSHLKTKEFVGGTRPDPAVSAALKKIANEGLETFGTLRFLLRRAQVIYCVESAPVTRSPIFKVSDLKQEDLIHLFRGSEVPAGLSPDEVAQQIRRRVPMDQLALSSRFNSFVGLAQFETSILISSCIGRLISMGGQGVAESLIEKWYHLLPKDNLLEKQQFIVEVVEACISSSMKKGKGPVKEQLGITVQALRRVGLSIDEYLRFFANVYRATGYQMPDLLLAERAPEPLAGEVDSKTRKRGGGAIKATGSKKGRRKKGG